MSPFTQSREETRVESLLWGLVVLVAFVEALRRWVTGTVPADMSAYIAAADVFARGENPYGPALFDSAHYDGFVYVYPPGTLPIVQFFSALPAKLVAAGDVLLRTAVLVFALGWVRRALDLALPLVWLVLVAFFFQPVLVDFMAGNLTTYMFGAFAACMWMAHDEAEWWHPLAAVGLGVVLAFKPMWGLPTGLLLLVRGRYKLAFGLLAGAGVVAGLSLLEWHGEVLVDAWLGRVEAVREHYRSADLLSLAPSLLPVAALAWLGAGAWLVYRRGRHDPLLWLWACVSLIAWPRLGVYSYVFALPALGYLSTRWGWRRALIVALPALGPLPWMFRAFGADFAQLVSLFVWIVVLAGCVLYELACEPRNRSKTSRSR